MAGPAHTQLADKVVVTARAKGVDLADVRVFIDGKLIAERLSGAAPGSGIRPAPVPLEGAPWPTVERNVLVSEGVKDRSMDAVFDPPDEPPPTFAAQPPAVAPQTTFRLQKSDYITGGIALAGFATVAVFGNAALARTDSCQRAQRLSPMCWDGEVAGVTNKALVADIALGVAGVASLRHSIILSLDREGNVLRFLRAVAVMALVSIVGWQSGCQLMVGADELQDRRCPETKRSARGDVSRNPTRKPAAPA